jgi:hypothetical protein
MPTSKGTKSTKKKIMPRPLYGRPVDAAISKGDVGEMRRVAAEARKYVSSLQTALKALDRKLGKG